MAVDDADTIRRFISQIKGQSEPSSLNTVTEPPSTQHDQAANDSEHTDDYNTSEVAKTPPQGTVAGQDRYHLTSPEAHPKPSPHVSGLKAPFNTPKTAASSPRLAAADAHNEDVADTFSEHVNTLHSRPLSESMWAPPSARQKPSMLSGARSTNVLTSIKAVEPNPAINDTFDRMSFKAADPDDKTGENLIGDHVTKSYLSKSRPSFVNQPSVLADKTQGLKADGAAQAKLESASDENFELPAHTETSEKIQKAQVNASRAGKENFPDAILTEHVGKENDALPAPKADKVPPHLQAARSSSQKPASKAEIAPPHLRAARSSSQKPVNAETDLPCPEGLDPVVTSKIVDSGSFKDAIQAATNDGETMVNTGPACTKPLIDSSPANENLEHKTFFNAWPKQEEKNRPTAKIRTIIIKDLPYGSTADFVASIVHGGPIEEIHIRSSTAGVLSAAVRFMDAGDCMKFYEETSNGLVYKKDAKGREIVLFVELSKDVNVVGGLLQGWIASGVTRCVRAMGAGSEWDLDGLRKIAERKNRKVEKIVDGHNAGGARSVVFRFCKVEDAVQFKAALSRDEDWEHCNIHYAADPCALASGVHLES